MPPRLNRLRLPAFGLLLSLFTLSALHGAATYDYHVTGDPAKPAPTKPEPALLLEGGGKDVEDAFRWFIKKAGGGRIAILRASGNIEGYHDFLFKTLGGVTSVETLLFHSRDASTDPRVLAIIARADGLWIAGGDQSRYVRYWKGTPVQTALDAHVRAGKPLGGTSAGLAVLGEFSFAALGTGDLTSAIALADPFDRRITLETDFLHLALLRGVITDSHFTPRARLGRSLAFLARLAAEQKPPRLAGLGIDERTALCIDADGTARVITSAEAGRVWLLLPQKPADTLIPKKPLVLRDTQVIALGPDSTFNLKTLAYTRPASVATVTAADGKLTSVP